MTSKPSSLLPYVVVPQRENPQARANPLVEELFAEMARQGVSAQELAKRVGLHGHTIGDWRTRYNPTLPNFIACVNALGFDLVMRERDQ